MATQHKGLSWTGWVLTVLIGLMMIASAVMKLLYSESIAASEDSPLGFTAGTVLAIGVVELACALLYLVPQTSTLGAVLLTGYLGGAIATHVRGQQPIFVPALLGVFVWLALFLRDPRVRALLPFRTTPHTTGAG